MEKWKEELKQKIVFMRKDWIDCNIIELKKKKEKSKLMKYTSLVTAIFIFFAAIDVYLEVSTSFGIVFFIFATMYYFIGMDCENDINRIDMWIYLKQKNGE